MSAERSPDAPVTLASATLAEMSGNERIKRESHGLFAVSDGKTVHGFRDEIEALESGKAPTLSNTAKELSKFYGIYKQQVRGARGKKTHDYIFMVRIKNPAGGRLSAQQWLALDEAGNVAAGAGLALIDWPPNHLGRLAFRPVAMDVYTHPKYRRRGLARRLMEAMTAWCNANDIPYLFLHASDDGRPLYEAMGFRATTEMHLALDR